MHQKPINPPKVNILMLSAGIITGAFRMMLDIIEHIDKNKFKIYVAYKPEYSEWGAYEIDLIKNSGATIVTLRGKRLFDIRGFIDLWNALQKYHIDILHSWDVLGIPTRIIGKLAGIKVVEVFASSPPVVMTDISLKHYIINKWTSFLVDGFVACSNGVMNKYQEKKLLFFKNKILSVVHNSIDVPDLGISEDKLMSIRMKYNLRKDEIILTNIGYFNEQKAQSDLLYTFKHVADNRADVRLIIVGWGRLEKVLKQLTKELGIEEKVLYTGKLLRPQVFEILSVTDLFVLSSHWEGLAIVIAEAMALGKPVVATDTCGSDEIIEDGKTGIIVPIKRPDVLAQTILDLLEKPDLMVEMGKRGLDRVKKYFNCERFIKGYEQFYLDVFQGNKN